MNSELLTAVTVEGLIVQSAEFAARELAPLPPALPGMPPRPVIPGESRFLPVFGESLVRLWLNSQYSLLTEALDVFVGSLLEAGAEDEDIQRYINLGVSPYLNSDEALTLARTLHPVTTTARK